MTRKEMLKKYYNAYDQYFFEVNDPDTIQRDSKYYDYVYGEYLPKNREGRTVDCGSGAGKFLYFLKRHGFVKSYGVDMSPKLITFQKDRLGVHSVQGDAIKHLKNAKPGFELISANDFLEHLLKEEIIEFLSLASEKLSLTGRLFIQTPNACNMFASRNRYTDFSHEVSFTENSLRTVLRVCGFQYINIISDFPHDKEPEEMQQVRVMYELFGKIPAPQVLSKNVIAICGHKPIERTSSKSV